MRTALGASLAKGKPTATIGLVAACVVVFLLQQVSGTLVNTLALAPANARAYPWILITSIFVHWNILHILMNMWALWSVGSYLEQMLGKARYLSLFFLSGFGGSVLIMLWTYVEPSHSMARTFSAGASGAIFGLFGALLLVSRKLHQNITGIMGVIALNLVFTFSVPGISWQAHIGGLVVGLIVGAIFAYAPRESRKSWAIVGSSAVALVLVGLAFFVIQSGVASRWIAG
jgi:membrane associated rhomboid family serine protease